MSVSTLAPEIVACIRLALQEDIGSGDVTTNSVIAPEAVAKCLIVGKQHGVVAGLDLAETVFQTLDGSIEFEPLIAEGATVEPGVFLASITGSARAILTGERTALNFLGRMSGIATTTRRFVDAVAGTRAIILDTRKTAPGLRAVDKLAVKRGGGENHRFGLYDMILIKNNHIDASGSLREAVTRASTAHPELEIEVEARSLHEVNAALELHAGRILLDNMTVAMMREAVAINDGRAKLEASGNVTLETVGEIAETGVDYISVGALTHSVKNFDLSLTWIDC
ncbi:MAG: carboxylating nicotinate-nucleotide diphosphorylase [Ignavibacteria bacterium]|nr:carboxylating nicotinate-nucleotide diphosphorylase [Ignavibacteria bacterium]